MTISKLCLECAEDTQHCQGSNHVSTYNDGQVCGCGPCQCACAKNEEPPAPEISYEQVGEWLANLRAESAGESILAGKGPDAGAHLFDQHVQAFIYYIRQQVAQEIRDGVSEYHGQPIEKMAQILEGLTE